MNEYLLLLLISVCIARGYDLLSRQTSLRERKLSKKALLLVMLVVLAGFAGLRTHCNDTGAYRHAYSLIDKDFLKNRDTSIGSNPLFNAINYYLKMHGVSTQNFLMFWAFLTVGGYIYLVEHYSVSMALTVFLLFTTGCYGFVFAGIKQAAAVALCGIAVCMYFKKKQILYTLLILLATQIHPYSLLYFAVPIMTFKPWTNKTYILLLGALLAGILLQPLLGTIVSITAMLGEEFTAQTFSGEGVNIFRVMVCNVPTILTFIYRKQLFHTRTTQAENMMVNLTMLNGAIMFVGLFGTANYFARLANYFLIFQSLSLPWILKRIGGKKQAELTVAMLVCYFAYFLYSNMIAIPFDQDFARLTLREYFTLLGSQ